MARGWIAAGDVEDSDRDTMDVAARYGDRVDRLLRRGLLDERSIAELLREEDGAADVGPPRRDPKTLGRYQVLGRLGAGGAGTVYRAHDPRLGRDVAIKVLPDSSAGGLAEARAQARIDHEHICKVFEVGELDGRPAIVMQLVEGETLRQAARAMTLEQKVTLMAQVADAIHAAHRLGLIHRDLKPTNIMVERGEKPYVMDFGLARDLEAARSLSGSVVGTPPYMSPEQARGDTRAVDRRSDVYSLGATLYEVLTGQPPFTGDTGAAVLLRVLADDPVSLRRLSPGLPMDLETVALKCLDKDPARRYDSARALADDLRRFLDGEPVLARRAGITYRLGKRLRKHRVAAAGLAAGLVALLVAGAVVVRARWRAAADAEEARRYGEEVQSIASTLRVAALAPLHDTRRERDMVRARMAEIERRMAETGKAGRAAGNVALGRGHLALGEPDAARARLETARRLGARGPDAALALAEALGAIYAREVERARSVGDDAERRALLEELARTLRAPALAALDEAGGATVENSRAYTDAIASYLRGDYATAVARARVAGDEQPWLYEARRLEGDAFRQQGETEADRGDYDAALASLGRAGERYAAALAVARSDGATHGAEFLRRRRVLEIRMDKKGDVEPADFDPAIAAFDDAMRAGAAPGNLNFWRAHLEVQRAVYLRQTGKGDPLPAISRALVHATLDDSPERWEVLGLAYWVRGNTIGERGGDPLPSLREAAAATERTLRDHPGSRRGHNTAGVILRAIADAELRRGLDPRPSLEAALVHYRRVAEVDPGFIGLWNNLSRALALRVQFDLEHGLDTTSSVREMVAAGRRGAEVDAKNYMMLINLGNVLNLSAEAERAAGRDPRPLLNEADAAYRRAAELKPTHPYAPANLGGDQLLLAEVELEAGADPRPALSQARDSFQAALARNPNHPSAHVGLVGAAAVEAEAELRDGRDPAAAVKRGTAALPRAREVRPGDDRLLVYEVRLLLVRAMFDDAERLLGAQLAGKPDSADLLAWRAEVRRRRAGRLTGAEAVAEMGRATEDATRAVGVNPRQRLAKRVLGE